MSGLAWSRIRGFLLFSALALLAIVAYQLSRIQALLEVNDNRTRSMAEHLHDWMHDQAAFSGHSHEAASRTGDAAPHLHNQFANATHSSGKSVLMAEWEPADKLVLAIPAKLHDNEAHLTLIENMASELFDKTSLGLLVLIEQDDVAIRAKLRRRFAARSLSTSRLEFLEVLALDSIWLRDYGPLFTRESGAISVVDPGYRDYRLAIEEGVGGAAAFGFAPTHRPADDMVPNVFSSMFGQRFVHPGFLLNGGDVYTDGRGTMFTSAETLQINAADQADLDALFARHLGCDRIHYLLPLPGPAVKHIDMFFKLVSPRTCLIGEYSELPGDDELSSLQHDALVSMEVNARRLTAAGLRVVRIPMPDIERISRWDHLERSVGEELRKKKVAEMGSAMSVSVDVVEQRLRSEFTYIYRTFTNSVHVVDQKGRHAVFIPEFAPREARDATIETAYRQAYHPQKIELAWVNAESIAHANGSLRCVSLALPRFAQSGQDSQHPKSR